jgi:hypothetical protein
MLCRTVIDLVSAGGVSGVSFTSEQDKTAIIETAAVRIDIPIILFIFY